MVRPQSMHMLEILGDTLVVAADPPPNRTGETGI